MHLFEFALASTLMEITPGPNMSYLATLVLARGFKSGLQAVAGVATGILVVGLLAAFGLAEFVNTYPAVETFLRWGGVLFMLGLAFESWREAGRNEDKTLHPGLDFYWRGLVTNLLNPKLFVFYIAMLPDFIDNQHGNILSQNITLVLIYTVIASLIHVGIVLFARQVRPVLNKAANAKMIGRIMAILLVAVAAWLFIEMPTD